MKRWLKRGIAGAVVAAALLAQVGVNAAAAPAPLDQASCRQRYDPTPVEQVTNAWHLQRLNMPAVWRIATGKGVKIGVVDTGVAIDGSPYFTGGRISTYDMISPSAQNPQEGFDCRHGTEVVSLLAAGRLDGDPGPNTDFAGIAPEARVYAYRALASSERQQKQQEQGQGTEDQEALVPVISGIRAAIEAKVDVINLSMDHYNESDKHLPEFRDVIQAAVSSGIVVVAAAGNKGDENSGPSYPAAFKGVISVGMSAKDNTAHPSSYANGKSTLGAPGAEIQVLLPSRPKTEATFANQAYGKDTGTSMAAPIVAGVVALMIQQHRDLHGPGARLSPEAIQKRLIQTADPPPSTLPDKRLGFGIVNPLRALAGPSAALKPTASATPPAHGDAFPPRPTPEELPRQLGLGIALGAVTFTVLGFVAAIAIPAARRHAAAATQTDHSRPQLPPALPEEAGPSRVAAARRDTHPGVAWISNPQPSADAQSAPAP